MPLVVLCVRAPAEFLERHVLAGDGLDPRRGRLMNICEVLSTMTMKSVSAGEYTCPPAGRAHDQRNLRDDARGPHGAVEDVAVQAERDNALLDPCAAALVDPDHRAAGLHGEVEHLDDLLAVDLAERAAEHRDVLAEDADRPAVDRAAAG